MQKSFYSKNYFLARLAELDCAYNAVKPDWQELADYFLPRSTRFLARTANKQPAKNKKIKDSAPLTALRNFSSGLISGACNPAVNWFRMKVKNFGKEQSYDVKNWCSSVDNLFRDIFNASNLYRVLPAAFKQLGVFGISVIALSGNRENPLHCTVLPIGSYRLAKNESGETDTIVRIYMETAKNLYDKFGAENVSKDVLDAVNSGRFEEPFEIAHFVEPNKDFMPSSPWAEHKEFVSVYLECSSKDDKFLSKSGFDKFPYAVFEAEINGEDIYPSECPGVNALPDVKQLMAMVVEEGKAVKKMVSPVYKGPASLKNKKLLDAPASFIEEDENGRGLSPVYEINPRVLEMDSIIDKLRTSIKEIFYNDLFAMILNTSARERTAFEVNELKEEKMVLLSPLLQQIHNGLAHIINRVFDECIKLDLLPEPPSEIQGQSLDIEFVSTLAQAQKASRAAAVEKFTNFTANLAASIDPALKNKINGAKIIDDYADFINISPDQLISDRELNIKKQKEQQNADAAANLDSLKKGAEIAKNLKGLDLSAAV